jgi:ABC-type antimicrobial peptide transport system permease subunit
VTTGGTKLIRSIVAQEIGIRMALGATTGDVKRQIAGQMLRLTAVGHVLGTAASWTLARGVEGLLFEVTRGDPRTFGAMVAVLTCVAVVAGDLPVAALRLSIRWWRCARSDELSPA